MPTPLLCANCEKPLPTGATTCPACGTPTGVVEQHTGGSGG
jgi:predicted amidophosphoribosyltransferase